MTWPIGGRVPSNSTHSGAHSSRATCSCAAETAFAWPAVRSANGVRPKPCSWPARAPELEQRLDADARRLGELAGVALDELLGEHLVAGRDRRVGREDRRRPDLLERLGDRHPPLDERAHALEHEEGRVALVEVEHGRPDAQRFERADAADAEQQLLADPVLAVAAVQRVGEPVDLEQVQRHGADVLAPDGRDDGLAGEVDRDGHRLADEAGRDRVDRVVLLRLAPGLVDALREVAPAVQQPDADDRHAELGRGLEVVAGEDAEPAGVDRERLLDRELHAHVRDEEPVLRAVRALPPRGGPGRDGRAHRRQAFAGSGPGT